jgi:hypothetical protein
LVLFLTADRAQDAHGTKTRVFYQLTIGVTTCEKNVRIRNGLLLPHQAEYRPDYHGHPPSAGDRADIARATGQEAECGTESATDE